MSGVTLIVGYLALFLGGGMLFVGLNMLIGRFFRPSSPDEEKLDIYECGEPTIGSSFVQFDLRFYVVALVFIIFDVEVAFLFPWATVYGKVNLLRDTEEVVTQNESGEPVYTADAAAIYRELGVQNASPITVPPASMEEEFAASTAGAMPVQAATWIETQSLNRLTKLAAAGISVFFVVLLIGFAYEWATGALDWVRAVTEEYRESASRGPPSPVSETPQPVESAPLSVSS